jgi:hypothetical protein
MNIQYIVIEEKNIVFGFFRLDKLPNQTGLIRFRFSLVWFGSVGLLWFCRPVWNKRQNKPAINMHGTVFNCPILVQLLFLKK